MSTDLHTQYCPSLTLVVNFRFLKIKRKLALLKNGKMQHIPSLLLDYNHCIVVLGHTFSFPIIPIHSIKFRWNEISINIGRYLNLYIIYFRQFEWIRSSRSSDITSYHLSIIITLHSQGWRPFFGSPVKNKEFRKEIRERLPSSVMTPAKNLFDKSDRNFSKAKMMLIAQCREQRRLTYCWFFCCITYAAKFEELKRILQRILT